MDELTDEQLKSLIPLPDFEFEGDEQREDFRDAVLSAISVYEKSSNPVAEHDILSSAGDSILIARGFEPNHWRKRLWDTVSAARQSTGNA